MLGFGDVWVFLAYFFSILAAVLCMVYGILNWNKGEEGEPRNVSQWRKDEMDMEKSID